MYTNIIKFVVSIKDLSFDLVHKNIIYPLFSKFTLLVVLILAGYLFQDFFETFENLGQLFGLLIFYMILTIIFEYGSSLIIFLYRKKNKLQTSHIDNFTIGIGRLSFFLAHAIFVLVSIHILFINILTLATSLTIVAVAMVLIFKDYISNFINGVLLMFSTDIKLKEFVKIGEYKGRVMNFTFKNVELKSETGDILYIPNTTVYTKEIINYSKNNIKNISVSLVAPSLLFKHYPQYKKQLRDFIFETYTELVKERSNITFVISEMKKDEFILNIDIIASKYSYKLENQVKDCIFEKHLELLSSFEDTKKKK